MRVAPAAFVRPLASMKRCITAGSLGVGAQSSTFQRNETHRLSASDFSASSGGEQL